MPTRLRNALASEFSGFNKAVLGMADSVVGNPVGGLVNALGGDVRYNPITRAAQSIGVGKGAGSRTEIAVNALVGMVPGYGDVVGLSQDFNALRSGELNADPLTLGLIASGVLPFVPRAGTARRTSAIIYDPPKVKQRSFSDDYPQASTGLDEGSALTRDIDGRPLGAEFIAGRRRVGGLDEGLRPEDVAAGTQRLTGTQPAAVAPRELKGDAGRVVETALPDGKVRQVLFANDLTPDKARRVIAHEFSHVIDAMTLDLSSSGLNKELRTIYSDLNKPHRGGKAFGPEQAGYKGSAVNDELVAEALRAYLADPNYIKTVAPKTAARLRAMVNADPRTNKTIQLNQLIPAAIGGGALLGGALSQDDNHGT